MKTSATTRLAVVSVVGVVMLGWTRAGIIVGCAAAFLCLGAPGQAVYVRWDDPAMPGQQPVLEGFLTSKGATNTISWDPAATSDDNMPTNPTPSDDDVEAKKFYADQAARYPYGAYSVYVAPATGPVTAGYRFTETASSMEFKSAALPSTLYINATRGFQVTLFLQARTENANPCNYRSDYTVSYAPAYWMEPEIVLELLADGKPIGGAYAGDYVLWSEVYPAKVAPTRPPGYGVCRYQMHSEQAVLPAGTILTLKVHTVQGQYHYPFGFQGDHRSSIRIWSYSPEELYYRYPDLAPSATDEEGEGGNDGSTYRSFEEGPAAARPASSEAGPLPLLPVVAAAGGAMVGLVTRGPGRRRPAALILVALLALTAVSGCLAGGGSNAGDGSDDQLKGKVDSTLIVDRLGVGGSVYGVVFDDMHIPVAGTHISIIGLSNFTETDSKGRFHFLGLIPGVYKMRFDKASYRSFEAEVEVKAGFVSRPEIMLYLKDAKERDFRPHTHDYWDQATVKDLGATVLSSTCTTTYLVTCSSAAVRIAPMGTSPNIIPPGAADLEITLDWNTGAMGTDRLGLSVSSLQGRNASTFAPRGPGVPFHVRTTWEMADVGHSVFSSWQFQWVLSGADRRTWEEERAQRESGHDSGTVTLKAKVYRGGTLPLEPPHIDRWQGNDVLHVLKEFPASPGIGGFMPPGDWPCVYYYDCYNVYNPYIYMTYNGGNGLIPTGTTYLEVQIRQTRDTKPQFGVNLHYKPSDVPYSSSNYQTLQGYQQATELSGGTWDKTIYRIPVKTGQTDPEYAKYGSWTMTIVADDADAQHQDYITNTVPAAYAGPVTGPVPYLQYFVNVYAHRDPMP